MEIAVPPDFSPNLHVLAVPVAATAPRAGARLLLRASLKERLAELLGVPAGLLVLHSIPGQPPRLAPPFAHVGVSLSHEPGCSVAAINLSGAVGIDLMRVPPLWSDLDSLVLDYLGPAVRDALGRVSAGRRQDAFAAAWTAHEARLKCLGLPLVEWTPGLAGRLAACFSCRLETPVGWVASVALS